MLTSSEAAVHIDNIHASFNLLFESKPFDYGIYSSVVSVHDIVCIGGAPSPMLEMLLEKNSFLNLFLALFYGAPKISIQRTCSIIYFT